MIAELGGMRFPVSSTAFYPLSRPGRPRDPRRSPTRWPRDAEHRDRPRRRADLCRARRGSAAAAARGRRRLAPGARGGCGPFGLQDAIRARDMGRLKALLERARADVGRPQLLRLRRHQPRFRLALVPSPRGVRPGRLRHRRLGHGFSQLDARDPARRRHQLRRGPAPCRGRGRAAAASHMADGA